MRRSRSRRHLALAAFLAVAVLTPVEATFAWARQEQPDATTPTAPATTVPATTTTVTAAEPATADPHTVEGHPHAHESGEVGEAADRTGVAFDSSPEEGLTGSEIEVAGAECVLADAGVPGEGVVVQVKSDGRVRGYATLPVAADGTWSGTVQVPADTPVGNAWVHARCIYPLAPDPVVYVARRFTVTGTGRATEATPRAPVFNGGIEQYAAYDGQSTCSPHTKPGMAAFMRLVFRHYGGGSLGVGRACGVGGTSEHKEGRAWDWAMNAGSARDRNRVQALMNWMFATDTQCRRFANARRLGMMYIIWNRRMFRMYDVDRGWAPYAGPSPHTDHVHFSLSRAGGAGSVSYWNPTFRARRNWSTQQRRIRSIGLGAAWHHVQPLSGDFDGDERADLLFYDPEGGGGFVGYSRPDGQFGVRTINVAPGRVPLVGDFNGNCRDDILWYGPGQIPDRQWRGRPNRSFRIVPDRVAGNFERPVVGDFNGDRVEDIYWYGPGPAPDRLWYGTIFGFVKRNVRRGGDFHPFVGNFDGDRFDDIFWYGPGRAADQIWFGRRRGWGRRNVGFPLDATPLVGDYNGDDRDDILWYRPGTLAERLWIGRKDRRFGNAPVDMSREYERPVVGDFDADLQDDIFWHASPRHGNRIWKF